MLSIILISFSITLQLVSSYETFKIFRNLCENESSARVIEFLETLVILNQRNGSNESFLHVAVCKNKMFPVVKYLINKGLDVDLVDDNGRTALHIACRVGHSETVKLLLKTKTDVNAITNFTKLTPIHIAALYGRTDIVRLLMEAGCIIDSVDQNLETPLHLAARGGHVEALSLITPLSKKLNSTDIDGRTALHLTVIEDRPECLQILLNHGANKEIVDKKNQRPIDIAILLNNRKIISALKDSSETLILDKVEVKSPNGNGKTTSNSNLITMVVPLSLVITILIILALFFYFYFSR